MGTGLADTDLEGAKFNDSDLTGATFRYAKLPDADFTGSVVRRVNFYAAVQGGFTRAMLESTASYQQRKLDGVVLASNNLQGWDFRGQDLRESDFRSSNFEETRFELADLRGARFSSLPTNDDVLASNFRRAILPDGSLPQLDVGVGEVLTIRAEPTLLAYTLDTTRPPPSPPTPPSGVKVMSSPATVQGELEILLGEGDWKSTVLFPRRASVALGGTLRLGFDELVNPAQAIGKSFALFVWPGSRSGEFQVVTQPNEIWDLSNLYTTGVVQFVAVVPEPSALLLAGVWSLTATMRSAGRRSLRRR